MQALYVLKVLDEPANQCIIVQHMGRDVLLQAVGNRVRRLRSDRNWSRRELSERTLLSQRFLAQVESGEGNPSIVSLAQIAAALDTTPAALLAPLARSPKVALLGLRGAGKSTVGRALARRLGCRFVELDARIEEGAGLTLRELFDLHGEDYYRRLEHEVLRALLAGEAPMVLATGGGIVTHAEAFAELRRRAATVWLRATPEEHWTRVVAQGDHRPMANDPLAMAHLRELLSSREELYRTADHIVDTSGLSVSAVVTRVAEVTARAAR